MSIKTIKQIINGEYMFEGQAVSVPIKSVVIDSQLADNIEELLSSCDLAGKALVVSDQNTHEVLGAKIEAALSIQPEQSLIFKGDVKADMPGVERIKCVAKSVDYIVAVGGGTINDLCKYASFLIRKPYVVFGTSSSMNGYSSANASITMSGHKKTVKAQLPRGVFLDLDVLAKSPIRLIRSGLGDSICRSTAQADWLLSHLLLGTTYAELPFELLKEYEGELLSNSKALVGGDVDMMRLLAETLILSGFGMYIAGGSYPASQGEHMISHTMEMAYGNSLPQSYHGEQIGVTTLTMARLQEKILESGFKLKEGDADAAICLNDLGMAPEIVTECRAEYKEKQLTWNNKLVENQINPSDILEKVANITISPNVIYSALINAGCPVKPKDIGWSEEKYNNAVQYARFTRNRFTFLDLV